MKAPRCHGGEPRPRRGANLHEDLEAGLLALLGFDQLQGDGLVRAEVRSHLLDFLLGQAVKLGGGGEAQGGAQSPPGLALPSLTPSRALPELVHPSALAPQSPLYPPIHPSSRRRRRPQQPSLPTRDSMRSPISLMIGPSSRSFFMDSERESGRGCEKTRSELGLLEGNLPRAAAPTPALQARRAKVGDARASRRWALADPRI